MADEKDRLGDTLRKKERGEEERYFAELDRQRLAKLRAATTCGRCGRPLAAAGAAPAPGACDGACG
jgi:hypothetical protein